MKDAGKIPWKYTWNEIYHFIVKKYKTVKKVFWWKNVSNKNWRKINLNGCGGGGDFQSFLSLSLPQEIHFLRLHE